MMLGIGELLLVFISIYYGITRIVPQFLRFLLKRFYHFDARFGRLSILYMTLHDVYINVSGYVIAIDQIGLRSSFLSSEVTKLLCIVIHDMRILKDMSNSSENIPWKPPDSLYNVKIPPLVITLAQFVSFSMVSVTCASLKDKCLNGVFHCTLNDVHLDTSVVHSLRSLIITLSLGSVNIRLLKPAQSAQCASLVHVTTTLNAEATVIATTPLSIQSLSVAFANMKTVVNDDDFFLNVDWVDDKTNRKGSGNMKQYYNYYSILSYIAPIIPKDLSVKFDNCLLVDTVGRDMAKLQKFHLGTSFLPVSLENNGIKANAAVNILIEEFNVQTDNDTKLILKMLDLEANLQDKRIFSKLAVNKFNTMYDCKKLNWFLHFMPEKESQHNGGWHWWPEFEIESNVELKDVSSIIKNHDIIMADMGLSHMKFLHHSPSDMNRDIYEISSESIWCQLHKPDGFTTETLKREHAWGTAFYLGTFLLKVNPSKLYSKLDLLRVEWSPPLADILTPILINLPKLLVSNKKEKSSSKTKFCANVSLTNTNLFFIADKKVCLMMRIDSCCLDSPVWPVKVSLLAEGTKMSAISPTSSTLPCSRYREIKNWFGNLEVTRIEYHNVTNSLLLRFTKQIQLIWSPNLHLKMMAMCSHLKSFHKNIKQSSESESGECKEKLDEGIKIQISLKGHVKWVFKMSKQHLLTFKTDEFNYLTSPNECLWGTALLEISVDTADVFTIEELQFATLSDSELIRTERINSEGFTLPWNRTWSITMTSIKAIFPYEHSFCVAVQDEFISIIKWVKRLHKDPSVTTKRLPPDLLIKVKEFLFEMSDDPFEVRLRDNFELLVDEYKESVKRKNMLDAKISELCKTHLLLPAGKVDELYANLLHMNAHIYVKRSRQIQQQGTRTRLFAWIVTDLQLIAMADPSIDGSENVIRCMTQIDPDTPWPEDGVEFGTLWCRSVVVNCKELKFQLRDFPQPWLDLGQLQMWGRFLGAEQLPSRRAKRVVTLELGEPWGCVDIERSMTSLKFYHDLNCEVEQFRYAFGPCWEPVIAQCNLSFEKILRPSLDPSPPLPLWDKLRLLLHGRVTMLIRQLTVLLHASLDPYNTTEEMEITWSNVAIDWTNAKVVFKGNLDIYVRTASKYDDCRLVHFPNLRLSVKLGWVCLGDPNDHHSVMPCAPDKLPDYSSNQEHDSFRAFRSQNLNISLALETKPMANGSTEIHCPVALLYGSTLRWFENLKLILSGATRPTRRGTVFRTTRPRKIPLSRHYRRVHLLLSLHTFQVHYWMSYAMQRGLELTGESISFSSEHLLSLVPVADGLKHRPRAEWSVVYMTCELHNAEIWLRSALPDEQCEERVMMHQPVEKCYFLSVSKVSYGREGSGQVSISTPTHRLVVYGLKGAWTMSNRDVVFALYDTFIKTKQLRKNLSTEALKDFRSDTGTSMKTQIQHPQESQAATNTSTIQATPSPMSKLQCGHVATMLQQLIAEVDTKAVVFSDEPASSPSEQPLQGLAACQHTDDVIHNNWLIALVNSQVLLKGPETKGYVIISAAKAEILQSVHRPVWRDRTLVTKTTWVGSLQSMQYYATVNAGKNDSLDENIMWLSVDNIEEKDDCIIAGLPDVPQLVGSGQSVGGVVSETVGASILGDNPPLQLQRIVSRCKCEFFYVCYGESSMSPSTLANVPTPPCEDSTSLWEHPQPPVDAFTLMHHDLDVCTNSLQYAMLLDIVNNLLLYVEPSRREAFERLQRMRFQLQLQSVEDQRRPIQAAQTAVRGLLSKLRGLEREMYLVQRALGDEPDSQHLAQQMDSLERQVYKCKETLNVQSMELDMMLSCYKETQLMANQKLATLRGDKSVSVVRANEICFKHAQWRLTEADGQLGIADLVLSNFLYTKNSKSDDSVEHLLELGYVRMTNLLPNQIYKDVLQPTEILNKMPVDRKKAVRVFCRERAPVGGIPVKEHFEINVVPLTIGLTKKFFNTMMKFCFPERETDDSELADDGEGVKKSKSLSKGKEANFYVPIERKDDVEKMKERAEKNKQFTYIKIPEVPVRVSYKGNKEKNVEDMRDFSLVIPTLEYHNVTWTWLDLLLAMKSDSRKVILSQAIKQKLQIKMKKTGTEEGTSPQEEDKVKILFGTTHMPGESKSLKRGIFKFPK